MFLKFAQRQVHAEQDRCVPEVLLSMHPESTDCLAAWIDDHDYYRQVNLLGRGFGAGTGIVELEQEDGDWVRVPVTYWSRTGITLNLPMRRDGFPANGTGPSVTSVEDPASRAAESGRYVLRVTNAEDYTSDPEPFEVVYQVYDQKWTPVLGGDGSFPDWVELWHPFTPEALWTNGPTVQISVAYNDSVEYAPVPRLDDLDADQDQPHLTTAALTAVGDWVYALPPAIRNLATAYDQEQPTVQYFGFRAGFPDDAVYPATWGYTLIYD
jgi:hypothetical protein